MKNYFLGAVAELLNAALIFAIGFILGWDTKEGKFIIIVSIVFIIFKLGILIFTEARYRQFEKTIEGHYESLGRKISDAVKDISRKSYEISYSKILIDLEPLLLKNYLSKYAENLTVKINNALGGENITDVILYELYGMIRGVCEDKKSKTIHSLDIEWTRWLGIFDGTDYLEAGFKAEEADAEVQQNEADQFLNDTTMLYNKQYDRLTNPSDELQIKRIFKVAPGDCKKDCKDAKILKRLLEKMCELQKEAQKTKKNRLETKILLTTTKVEKEMGDILRNLSDIVVFNRELLFREVRRSQTGHSIILKKEDIDDYIENFDKVWAKAEPITKFLNSKLKCNT